MLDCFHVFIYLDISASKVTSNYLYSRPVIRGRPAAKRAIYICGRPRWVFVLIFSSGKCSPWSRNFLHSSNLGCSFNPCSFPIFYDSATFSSILQQVSSFGLFLLVSLLFYGHLLLDFLVNCILRNFNLNIVSICPWFYVDFPHSFQLPSCMQALEHLTWKHV